MMDIKLFKKEEEALYEGLYESVQAQLWRSENSASTG